MINTNTIKAAARHANPELTILSVKHHKFGMFTVRVSKSFKHQNIYGETEKIGFIMGETDFNKSPNGVVLSKVQF